MKVSTTRVAVGIALGLICASILVPLSIKYHNRLGSSLEKTVAVDVWFFGMESEKTMNLLYTFKVDYHDLRIRMRNCSWSSPHINEMMSLAGDDRAPEIIQIGSTWLPQFIAAKALQPLPPHLRPVWDRCLPVFETMTAPADRAFALPWYLEIRGLVYRKDILSQYGFNQFPRTYAEFTRMLPRLKGDRNRDDYYPLNFPYDDGLFFLLNARGRGINLADFAGPTAGYVFHDYVSLFSDGYSASTGLEKGRNPYEAFRTGQYLIMPAGPYTIKVLKDYYVCGSEKIAIAPIPGDTMPVVFAGGSLLGIPAVSNHPDISAQLLTFLMKDESQSELFLATGDLPAVREAYDIPALKYDPLSQGFLDLLPYVWIPDSSGKWEACLSAVNAALKNSIVNQQPAAKQYQTLSAAVARYLDNQ